MIQINLSTAKKPMDLTNVGGFDLSKLNVKLVLVAILSLYVPDWLLLDTFEAEREKAGAELAELGSKKNTLEKRVNSLKEFDKQIQQLKRREQQLTEKLDVVKKILTEKRNPWNILVYVAQNIPAEIWLKEILFSEDKLVLKCISVDYTHQGIFLENLKKSVFFQRVEYKKIDEAGVTENKNLAPFEITAQISRFE